jgi:hypothetical protein
MAPRRGAAGQRLLAVLVAGAAATGIGAPVAAAAEPGVHVDPGSPAGKEYALPVDQARHDAGGAATGGGSGSGGGPSSGSGSTGGGALFGAGVRPSGQRPGTGGSTTGGRPGQGGTQGTSHRDGVAAAIPAASSSGDSMTGPVLGIAAGVVLLGLVAGLSARRSRASGPTSPRRGAAGGAP